MRMDISHMVNAQITLCLNAHPGDMLIQGMAALLDRLCCLPSGMSHGRVGRHPRTSRLYFGARTLSTGHSPCVEGPDYISIPCL
ncbi:hypothetical protein M752DRAFT_76761 [Aspergillus phoenicis ATCC 13157]|uniref:Uncharacterized protein n=1 Tax=Aspergillus phoenicis ATCC 13157 TaxID=1353007 RepID=A0A370P8X4_ASPPH|nr:hypothetical protein M752DRAFT_76761 [Aspergillus phoenicis ATCC 13157]